jgi:hypothetical protein
MHPADVVGTPIDGEPGVGTVGAPAGIAIDTYNTIYLFQNTPGSKLRKITSDTTISSIGDMILSTGAQVRGGPRELGFGRGLAVDNSSGTLYFSQASSASVSATAINCIRKLRIRCDQKTGL